MSQLAEAVLLLCPDKR